MNWLYKLTPLTLFLAGLVAGMQLAFTANPLLVTAAFTCFYLRLLGVRHNLKQSLWYSFFFGYGFFLWGHGWISQPLSSFQNMFAHYEFWAFMFIPAILSGYFLLIGWLNFYIQAVGHSRVLIFTVILWVVEYLRCYVAPAVPLGQIGTIWFDVRYVAMVASIFGVYGLSFLTYYFAFAVAATMLKNKVSLVACGLIFLVVPVLGYWSMPVNLKKDNAFVRLVPTSWPQVEKYKSLEMRIKHLKELAHKSQRQINTLAPPNLIVWPETTIEFSLLQKKWGYNFMYPEVATYLNRNLLIGALANAGLLAGVAFRGNEGSFNAATLLTQNGFQYLYKKRYLAPFGEFTPSLLKPVFKILGIPMMGQFLEGPSVQQLLILPSLNIRMLICYEGSYSRTIRQQSDYINMLTVITNDAWFGLNGKQQQFISHAFRAIEEGVPMVRCANSGYSGYILPNGSYYASLEHQPIDVQLHKALKPTVFSMLNAFWVYWVEALMLLFMALSISLEVRTRKRGVNG